MEYLFFRPAYLFRTENVKVDILVKFLYIKCFTTNPQTYRSKIPNVTNIITIQRRQTINIGLFSYNWFTAVH